MTGLWLLLGATSLPTATFAQVPAKPEIAITRATVVDVETGQLLPDRTVLIGGNRVSWVAPSAEGDVPPEAEVIDGTGRYVIPGLWDMHTHAVWHDHGPRPNDQSAHFPLFIAYGITGIRDMSGHADTARVLRRRIIDGDTIGPRIVAAGNIIDGPDMVWEGNLAAGTPERGAFLVDSLAAAGADFIKTYSRLPRDVYFAIAERADELDIPLVGHVPLSVTALEAIEAGHHGMAHLRDLELDCSSREEELRRIPWGQEARRLAIASHDPERCRMLIDRLAKNRVWQTPTRVVRQKWLSTGSPLDDVDGRWYAPPIVQRAWERQSAAQEALTQDEREERRAQFQWRQDLLRKLHEGGVPLLAGSDVDSDGSSFLVAGVALHEELRLFVEAGLTPLEALRTATINPARYLDATDSLGTVAPGKLADLVVLDANPLEDIANTQRIHAVVADGRLLARDDLRGLREEVLAQNYRKALAPPAAEPQHLSPEQAHAYDGTYVRLRDGEIIARVEIRAAGGGLQAVSPTGESRDLTYLGENVFGQSLFPRTLLVFQMGGDGIAQGFTVIGEMLENVSRFQRRE